jgi:cell shape-determining protein MreC
VAGLLLAAMSLNVVPPETLDRIRAVFLDVLRPGQLVLRDVPRWFPATVSPAQATGEPGQIAALEGRVRELELERQQLRDRLAAVETWGRRPRGQKTEPLVVPALVATRWLGEELSLMWRSRGMLAVGGRDGVHENALVVQSELPLVDVGDSHQVAVGNPVFAGRVVVGKIAAVGRQTSTVRRVTDAGYSDRVRVARRTPEGLLLIAEGTLVGEGQPLCRLRHITEPVAEGDLVLTSGTDGILPLPMYYGTVTEASLDTAGREWQVIVQPAARSGTLTDVEVLRLDWKADGVLAN